MADLSTIPRRWNASNIWQFRQLGATCGFRPVELAVLDLLQERWDFQPSGQALIVPPTQFSSDVYALLTQITETLVCRRETE